jgi:hypothetical protein
MQWWASYFYKVTVLLYFCYWWKKLATFNPLPIFPPATVTTHCCDKCFFIMYFGQQDTKPPPCPLHLTKQGGSIHWSKFYSCISCKLVLYISGDHNYALYVTRSSLWIKLTYIITGFVNVWHFSGEMFASELFSWPCAPGPLRGRYWWYPYFIKATILCPIPYHIVLCYITKQYFIFLWFFVVLYHTHTQYVGENVCYDIEY